MGNQAITGQHTHNKGKFCIANPLIFGETHVDIGATRLSKNIFAKKKKANSCSKNTYCIDAIASK